MTPNQTKQWALAKAEILTNGWQKSFSFEEGMTFYALYSIFRIHQGEVLNDYAYGVIEYWGKRYFPYCVQLAVESWWHIHKDDFKVQFDNFNARVLWGGEIVVWDQPITAPIGTKFTIIGKLDSGTDLLVLDESALQYHIQAGELDGWVMKVAVSKS